jgi:hypothetical protein
VLSHNIRSRDLKLVNANAPIDLKGNLININNLKHKILYKSKWANIKTIYSYTLL